MERSFSSICCFFPLLDGFYQASESTLNIIRILVKMTMILTSSTATANNIQNVSLGTSHCILLTIDIFIQTAGMMHENLTPPLKSRLTENQFETENGHRP